MCCMTCRAMYLSTNSRPRIPNFMVLVMRHHTHVDEYLTYPFCKARLLQALCPLGKFMTHDFYSLWSLVKIPTMLFGVLRLGKADTHDGRQRRQRRTRL